MTAQDKEQLFRSWMKSRAEIPSIHLQEETLCGYCSALKQGWQFALSRGVMLSKNSPYDYDNADDFDEQRLKIQNAGIRIAGDPAMGFKWYHDYLTVLNASVAEYELTKFKSLLKWFYTQLSINNDVIQGKKVAGQGHAGDNIRDYYEQWSDFNGFSVDCSLQCGFQKDSEANYIHHKNEVQNIVPVFKKEAGKSSKVIGFKITIKNRNNIKRREYRYFTIEELGLNGDETTDDLRKLYILFKSEIEVCNARKSSNPPKDPPPEDTSTPYTKEKFLAEVFMSENDYNGLRALLFGKKNIILQGAPGVGKTFAAKRLAYSIMGDKDDDRIEFVQFHQNYAYEDFIMGYKPTENGGFRLTEGVFYRFCKKAAEHRDKKYFFIIDEINRGNMSKIFGELLMLIEKDYRGETHAIRLAYQKESDPKFYVPENLYIIGMMNTADRSLAMIDYALRRRFGFCEIHPAFDTAEFGAYCKKASLIGKKFNDLIDTVKKLNEAITLDPSLGDGFCIGHSYFCLAGNENGDNLDLRLSAVVNYDIIPTLKEYWFDNETMFKEWQRKLQDAIGESAITEASGATNDRQE